jgi:hypothetical protein
MRYGLLMNSTLSEGGTVNSKTEEKFSPPYISFRTLTNLVDRLKEEGLPPQLDRSFLGGSEGYKTQVLAALRGLGMIGPNGEVLPRLTDLVNADNEARREIIRTILEQYFPEPVRLGSINATQLQLEDAFREFGISGDTLRKAVAFYLKGAEYAGIPVSQHFKTPKVTRKAGSAASRPRTNGTGRSQTPPGGPDKTETPPPAAATMSVSVQTALAGVLMQLPPNGPPWTAERRDDFKKAFAIVLDFSYPVTESSGEYEEDDEYEED